MGINFLAYLGPGFAASTLEAIVAVTAGAGFLLLGTVYYPAKIILRSVFSNASVVEKVETPPTQ